MKPYWALIALLDLGNGCLKPKSCPNPVELSPYVKSPLTARMSLEIEVLKSSRFWFLLLPSLSAVGSCSRVLVSWDPELVCRNPGIFTISVLSCVADGESC